VALIERLLDIPNTVAVKWSSPKVANFIEGMRRFVPRAAVVNNGGVLAVYSHILGARAWVSHVPNFFPEFCWRVHALMEAERYQEAQRVYSEFMGPYARLRAAVGGATVGEGVFVKPGMEAAGLVGGCSRLPSRDEAVTPEIRKGFVKLLESARAAVAV
jgi:dihydrodipicolinate synthase/N-acetylneuraminate lyase